MSEKAIERITEYYGGHAAVFRRESITQSQLKAVEIKETASLNWGPDWRPWQIWW
jgi:hypothetical protein